MSRIHYDVDGRRVLDDKPIMPDFIAYVDDSVYIDHSLAAIAARIEIRAFGERIAFKKSTDPIRTAGLVPFAVPPTTLYFVALLGLVGLLAWSARRGALVLVLERPGYAGVSAVLVVALLLGPIPVRVARAGGGPGSTIYWELADRLGTGMVMLDETGARLVHRTYTPFGVEHASISTAAWLPSHYAGHLEDEDSGLVYMQARWMDPASGTFLSVDPVVGDAADPQAYNAYAYARNNPVSKIDPTGASQIDCFGNCGGTMYFSGPSGSFIVPFSSAQAGIVWDFASQFGAVGGFVSVNGFDVSFSGSLSGDAGATSASDLTPAERQAAFDEGLAASRADGLIPDDFEVNFENVFAAGKLNADGTVDTGTLKRFGTAGEAATHADKIGGKTLNGLGGRPATVFAGAITMQRTLNVYVVRDVTINFRSFARAAQFTILHEFQHFQGIRAGPIGERMANRNALRAMGISF